MTKTALLSILAITLIITIACGIPASHSDPFYSAWEHWGVARFPLIKPYEAYFVVGIDWWAIDLDYGLDYELSDEMKYYMSILDIRKVAVENDVIMVYSPYEQKRDNLGTQKVLYWFVIISDEAENTKDDIIRGFDEESDFLEFIGEYGIDTITWESPDDLKNRFVWTGCLEWIPECD